MSATWHWRKYIYDGDEYVIDLTRLSCVKARPYGNEIDYVALTDSGWLYISKEIFDEIKDKAI